jgi:chromosome segregation ATPase
MNIYSIEEIIKASNSILKKKDAPFYNNLELNKVKKIKNQKKPLVIQNKDFIKRVPVFIHNVNKDELLNKLYNFFKNKVKKNTIRLIIELKEEIVSLGNKISVLKFQSEDKDKTNILLKKDILDLVNEKNNLKYNLKKNIININLLQVKNKNLESKYLEIENNLETLKNNKHELKKENDKLQNLTNTLKIPQNIIDENKKQIENLENKIIFYQEDSLRINNELLVSQNKFKNINLEINNLKDERVNLIERINSINDVIKEENIVSNVFINDIKENKIKVIESSKKTENDKTELDKTIKGIFSLKK